MLETHGWLLGSPELCDVKFVICQNVIKRAKIPHILAGGCGGCSLFSYIFIHQIVSTTYLIL